MNKDVMYKLVLIRWRTDVMHGPVIRPRRKDVMHGPVIRPRRKDVMHPSTPLWGYQLRHLEGMSRYTTREQCECHD